ncbi:uncharacterized protein LOC119738654 [Patiria miniata]|uniref:Uncharacterized protein n=1 Tax=Patiria miniata TaxID=46514 RepID=A0A914AZA7_PATMI|nr:uncharacterized protein LOC119738654 [Patiria miniata]
MHDLLDHPEVWSRLAVGVVGEMCGGHPAYSPVLMLRENGGECLPLQVFADGKSLNSGSLLKLEPTQARLIPTAHDRKFGPIRNALRAIRQSFSGRGLHSVPTDEIAILEETCPLSGPDSFEFLQISRCFQQPVGGDKSSRKGGRQTELKLGIYNVRTRRVDPRKLLGCCVDPASPVAKLKKRKFFMVYETYVAGEVTLSARARAHRARRGVPTGDITLSTKRDCPVCFRCVEVILSRSGIVKNLRFDVRLRELSTIKDQAVLPTMKILMLK